MGSAVLDQTILDRLPHALPRANRHARVRSMTGPGGRRGIPVSGRQSMPGVQVALRGGGGLR